MYNPSRSSERIGGINTSSWESARVTKKFEFSEECYLGYLEDMARIRLASMTGHVREPVWYLGGGAVQKCLTSGVSDFKELSCFQHFMDT